MRITVLYDWLKASHPFLSQSEYRARFPRWQAVDYREEKSLRHVPIVVKFLDENKPRIHLKSSLLFQTSSILFNFIEFIKCWRNFLGLIRKDRI